MIKEFDKRKSVEEVEEGKILQPKFDHNDLIPVITVDKSNSEILMHGYMNQEANKRSTLLVSQQKMYLEKRNDKRINSKNKTN